MKTLAWYRMYRVALLLGAAVMATGCAYDMYDTYDSRPVYRDDSYLYDYYYYPSIGVYFHLYSGYYYYHDDRNWYRSRKLPPRYRLDSHDRIKFYDRSERPYLHFDSHREEYRPSPEYRPDPDRDRSEREYLRKETPSRSKVRDDGPAQVEKEYVPKPASEERGFKPKPASEEDDFKPKRALD